MNPPTNRCSDQGNPCAPRRKARVVSAPTDGRPFFLGFQSTEVELPELETSAYFHFVFERAHSFGYFQLLFRNRVFPGYIYALDTFFSPSGRYFAANWTGPYYDAFKPTFVVIDLLEWRWVESNVFIAKNADEQGINGEDIGGNISSINFLRQSAWNAA